LIRIVFIITGLSTGGAEMMLFKVLQRLDRQRFSPQVISLSTMGELAPRITALGIPVQALGMNLRLPSPGKFFRLVRILRCSHPDLVHTWLYHADLLGGLAARLAGISAVGWCVRNSDLDRGNARLSIRAVVRLCAWLSKWIPRRILSCSEKARHLHVGYGYAAEKMLVVPNGFDIAQFVPSGEARRGVRKDLGLEENTLLVGLIGRFDPQKNHAGFLKAAGALHRRMPQVHFVMAGKGIDSNNTALMQSVTAAGVVSNVHLLGLRDDMPRLMAALDVLASSSYGEGFPNVLGEAMACGVPCVVTDVGDSIDIVGDTGLGVEPHDMQRLAIALEELLTMPPAERAALGERARERVATHFEIGKVVRQYQEFYELLLTDARAAPG
jgi:glycosyltransferase involved in cell wall biosynthesis